MGTVAEVVIDGLLAKVVLAVGASVSLPSSRPMRLTSLPWKPGDTAFALIKATEVMIARP